MHSFVNWLTRLPDDLVPPVAAEPPMYCYTREALQQPSQATSALSSSPRTKSGEP